MVIKKFFLLFFAIVMLHGCGIMKKFRKKTVSKQTLIDSNNQHVVIFVHGTLGAIYSPMIHSFSMPQGLCRAADYKISKAMDGRFGKILCQYSNGRYNYDNFYFFNWAGKLSLKERELAAQNLYHILENFKGKITIIAHSHGGNVVLNLAKVAKNHSDINFKIDELILMACPVQRFTMDFVKDPIFKKVISIYSTADIFQIADPQGIYKEAKLKKLEGEEVPTFSQRRFPYSSNLTQVRIFKNKNNPGHAYFILPTFAKKLTAVLDLVEEKGQNNIGYTINIENKRNKQEKPYFVIPILRQDGRKKYIKA